MQICSVMADMIVLGSFSSWMAFGGYNVTWALGKVNGQDVRTLHLRNNTKSYSLKASGHGQSHPCSVVSFRRACIAKRDTQLSLLFIAVFLMENEIDDGLFWLPTEFLNGNDGNDGFKSVKHPTFGVFGSGLCSPIESVVGSTKNESDEECYLNVGYWKS
ncbi:hypothetical protein Tco_1568430 [Tanacetum coccineum]